MTGGTPPSQSTDEPVRCAVWGVLNVTPDSFSDGGAYANAEAAIDQGRRLMGEGADVIDVGGESTRPKGATYGEGYAPVGIEEELQRVLPVIEGLVGAGAVVSIDTVKAEVATKCLAAGARYVNDVSCGASESLLREAASANAELVLMHNRGRGEVSGENARYRDVVEDVCAELQEAAARAMKAGVRQSNIWIDPGIGFAKTAVQSALLIGRTDRLTQLGHRVLVGPSRKSFIAHVAPNADGSSPAPTDRLGGTAASIALAVYQGAHAVRVHDVRMMRQAVRVAEAAARSRGART